jgi:GntR family phosphonate transport system transcriptional regulator
VLTSQAVAAPPRVARKLQLTPEALVLRLTVLGDADGMPLQVSERYFPLPRFEHLEDVVRRTGSITEAFQACGVADYTRHSSRIGADMPDADLADQLHQPATRPVLKVESLNVDVAGVPIEFSTAWFAADRVTLNVMHQEPNP